MKTFLLKAFIMGVILVFQGCGTKEFFGNYLPFSTGYKWIFEDEAGTPAEIEVFSDSLTSFRDTVFQVFFLGENIDFIKTPNTLSWRLVNRVVIEDREVYLEDRYYPFFEEPFVDNELRKIVYESRDSETGAYFNRYYYYRYSVGNGDSVLIDIFSTTLYIHNGDSLKSNSEYVFYLVPDTGFVRIIYTENGHSHVFHLKEYRGE